MVNHVEIQDTGMRTSLRRSLARALPIPELAPVTRAVGIFVVKGKDGGMKDSNLELYLPPHRCSIQAAKYSVRPRIWHSVVTH